MKKQTMVFGICVICCCDSVFQKALFWDFQNFFRRRIQFKTQNFRAWKNRITRTNINYAKLQEFLKYCKFHSTGIKWNLMIWKVIKNSKADHKYATEITSGVEGLRYPLNLPKVRFRRLCRKTKTQLFVSRWSFQTPTVPGRRKKNHREFSKVGPELPR